VGGVCNQCRCYDNISLNSSHLKLKQNEKENYLSGAVLGDSSVRYCAIRIYQY
jgi:hypothetical protein